MFLSWFKFSTFSPATVSTLFTLLHLFTFYLYLELLITFYGNFSNITRSVFINKNLQQQFIFLLILFSFFTFSSKKVQWDSYWIDCPSFLFLSQENSFLLYHFPYITLYNLISIFSLELGFSLQIELKSIRLVKVNVNLAKKMHKAYEGKYGKHATEKKEKE